MFVDFDAAFGSCEIGCWLEPSAEGHGLITPACGALLDWAFAARGLHRAEWHCRADNDRSAAVAKRLGMTLEGVRREAWPYDGHAARQAGLGGPRAGVARSGAVTDDPCQERNFMHERVRRVSTALREHGSAAEVVELPCPAPTAADAAAQLGCTVGAVANSLVFSVDSTPCSS